MLKKLVSAICLWAVLGSVVTLPAYAATIQVPGIIQGVTLTVTGSTPQTFEPSAGQLLKTAATFNSSFSQQLSQSTGYVAVTKGTVLIKVLNSWSASAVPPTTIPASISDWDGKSIEDTPEAKAVCGSVGAVCPVGDYQIETFAQYTASLDTIFDKTVTAFKIFVTPAVAISNLALSSTSFSPATQTSDISFSIGNNGFVTVEVLDGTTVKRTLIANENLTAGAYSKTNKAALAWDGKDSSGVVLPNKAYTIKVTTKQAASDVAVADTKTISVTVNSPSVSISSFTLTPTPVVTGGTFDPSASGANQDLNITYALNQAADVSVEITNPKGLLVKSFSTSNTSNNTTSPFTWDGIYNTKIVAPGLYTAKITATLSGTPVTKTETFTVAYNNSNKGTITGFAVTPTTFSSNSEDAVIKFTSSVTTNGTVEVRASDDSVIRTIEDKEYLKDISNSLSWDGTYSNGNSVPTGTYRVVVTLTNAYGVITSEQNVTVNNSGTTVSTENAHIAGISFSPSYNFDPAKNDQLKIEYDIKQKLDTLKIYAMRGADKIELQSETSIEKETNIQVEWDGTDTDGEYVDAGIWKIQFESKVGSQNLVAAKTVNVTYTKPEVTDLYLSKTKFDNDQNEFTYIFFRTDITSDVTIQILMDNLEQENIVEDMAVDGNKWYAVSWDGSGYSYSDNLDIKILAQNSVNHNIFNSKKVGVDVAEDKVSSNKSNITQDYITPVATDGNQEMQLLYTISEVADVKVTIHRGNTNTGTVVATLLDVKDQDNGDHAVSWDGKDDSGKTLTKGLYTYKIISNTTTTDTETGLFAVGTVGEVEGGGSSSSSGSSSSNNGGNVGTGVVVDGKPTGTVKDPVKDTGYGIGNPMPEDCAAFTDVTTKHQYCTAIQWTKEQGIFKGYADGSFGINRPISRVELLKVIMESLHIATKAAVGNLGFSDVTSGLWYMEYLQAGKTLGIMNGDAGKGTVRPNDPSQRVEALKMIFEAMKAVGTISQIDEKCTVSHPDVLVSSWYGKYVCEADSLGLYDSESDGYFGTATLSTRGEIAEVLYRLHMQNLF